jgi:peptidoglycan-associated lipoprotein
MKRIAALAFVVLSLAIAGCSKSKQTQPDSPPQATPPTAGTTTSGVDTPPVVTQPASQLSAQQQALAALKQRTVVYFEYDSSEIRGEDLEVVTAFAAYLVKYPGSVLRLEGHTDERGSREYNIGLGERRAQTVRRALMLQGVADAQLTTVSYGEERPAAEGSDESAYSQNRRVELAPAQ